MGIDRIMKRFIYTEPYNFLYPLYKDSKLISAINNADFSDGSDLTKSIEGLLGYILSNISVFDIEKDKNERSLRSFFKVKKEKYKDKDTGKRVVEKSVVPRKRLGYKDEINRYNEYIEKLDADTEELERLSNRLVDQKLLESDEELLGRILHSNRFRVRFYVSIIVIVIVVIVLLLIF